VKLVPLGVSGLSDINTFVANLFVSVLSITFNTSASTIVTSATLASTIIESTVYSVSMVSYLFISLVQISVGRQPCKYEFLEAPFDSGNISTTGLIAINETNIFAVATHAAQSKAYIAYINVLIEVITNVTEEYAGYCEEVRGANLSCVFITNGTAQSLIEKWIIIREVARSRENKTDWTTTLISSFNISTLATLSSAVIETRLYMTNIQIVTVTMTSSLVFNKFRGVKKCGSRTKGSGESGKSSEVEYSKCASEGAKACKRRGKFWKKNAHHKRKHCKRNHNDARKNHRSNNENMATSFKTIVTNMGNRRALIAINVKMVNNQIQLEGNMTLAISNFTSTYEKIDSNLTSEYNEAINKIYESFEKRAVAVENRCGDKVTIILTGADTCPNCTSKYANQVLESQSNHSQGYEKCRQKAEDTLILGLNNVTVSQKKMSEYFNEITKRIEACIKATGCSQNDCGCLSW